MKDNQRGKKILDGLRGRWNRPGGYREVLKLALPLIVTIGSVSVMFFVDRIFLSKYSTEAIAAVVPGGIMSWMSLCFFFGVVSYSSAFVAQYCGAGMEEKVGPVVWQALFFAIVSGVVVLGAVPLAGPLFHVIGHGEQVEQLEIAYFRILCMGAWLIIVRGAVAAFFSGRGDTLTIMRAVLVGIGVNILFDYLWIFGKAGFPEMGIRGAAWATVLGNGVSTSILFIQLLGPAYREKYNTIKGCRFDSALFRRLMRFGVPNGAKFVLDMISISIFVMLVGQLGVEKLAATNICHSISELSFMPMIGFGVATSILVAKALGMDRPDLARRAAFSAFHMTCVYMGTMALLFVTIPGVLISLFRGGIDPSSFGRIRENVIGLLRFVAVCNVFNTANIIFSSVVRGAGDTRFVMKMSVVLGWFGLVIPSYVLLKVLGLGLYSAWTALLFYTALLGVCYFLRFRSGVWESMRVIDVTASVAGHEPEGVSPALEAGIQVLEEYPENETDPA